MEEETKKQIEKQITKDVAKIKGKVEEHKIIQKQADKEIKREVKEEIKKPEVIDKKSEKKKEKRKKTEDRPKKTEAIINGMNLPISTKHSIAICNYIRGKNVDKAISMLEEVGKFKKPIPMRGEIAHRKGKIMSGRYPIKAVREFIRLLRSLKANATVNELELEKYVIFCKANVAPRPYKRFGRARFKRTHVTLKLIQPIKKKKTRKEVKR